MIFKVNKKKLKNSIIKKFDSVQDDYNLLRLQLPNYLTSKQNFVIRSPFATGLLSGKVNSNTNVDLKLIIKIMSMLK